MENNAPLISVVTVCYNAAKSIEGTILSVLNQTYQNVEYIIIDGGSTDGTVDIIRKYANRLAYWVSEPDKGIYDAMNKGIAAATGDYINFMNADDTFYDNNVLNEIFSCPNNADIIYGRTFRVTPNYSFIEKNLPLTMLEENMAFGHQAAFSRTDLMKTIMFDTKYRCAADYKFFYDIWKKHGTFYEVSTIVSRFNACDGFSAKNLKLSWREVAVINGNWKKNTWRLRFYLRCFQYNTKSLVKKVLPKGVIKKINIMNIKANIEDKC